MKKHFSLHYFIKDTFELSEREMCYTYAGIGFVCASIIWWIL